MEDDFSLPDDFDFPDDDQHEQQKWQRMFSDPRDTQQLITCALIRDAEEAIDAITILQMRATPEVLDAARALCASALVADRQLGISILSRLGDTVPILRVARRLRASGDEQLSAHAEDLYARFGGGREMRPYPKEALSILLPMLQTETDIEVLRVVIFALGEYIEFHPSVTAHIAALRTHPHPDVRFSVANRLASDVENPSAQQAIEELSHDEDESVREIAQDWMELVRMARKEQRVEEDEEE